MNKIGWVFRFCGLFGVGYFVYVSYQQGYSSGLGLIFFLLILVVLFALASIISNPRFTLFPVTNTKENASKQVNAGPISRIIQICAIAVGVFIIASPVLINAVPRYFEASDQAGLTQDAVGRMSASMSSEASSYYSSYKTYGMEAKGNCKEVANSINVFGNRTMTTLLDFYRPFDPMGSYCQISAGGEEYAATFKLRRSFNDWYCIDSSGFSGVTKGNKISSPGDISCSS